MDVSTQQMTYVVNLAKTLNFQNAATISFTSQPNLSMQIKKLEEKLGAALFERSNKAVHLTEFGKKAVTVFESILHQINTLEDHESDPFKKTYKIGIFPTLAPYYLPKMLQSLCQKYTDLTIEIVEDKTENIVQGLNDHSLDAIIAAYPLPNEELNHQKLFSDPFYLAVQKNHPLAKQTAISMDVIKKETLLLLEEGHCLRDQALEVCHTHRFQIDTSMRYTSLETIKAMVESGRGVTIVPKIAIHPKDRLAYIPFQNPIHRDIHLFWRQTDARTEFWKTLSKYL